VYQYLDRSVSDLNASEGLLVWAMRQWVAAMRGGRCPCAALGPMLASRQLAAMLPDFNIAMMLLDREGHAQLQFCRVDCGRVGDDEALLLSLYAAAARGEEILAGRIAEALVRPAAQRSLQFAAGRIALFMAA
jgi:hypothetical protein